ncbi:MAG: type II methionyl aminopeptidase [Candidatus Woesearchaeota archaeon]
MNNSELEKWHEAGRIAAKALEYGTSLIKKGAVVREVCDLIDQKIVELGAKPAWPSQVSINHIAAHFTPDEDDGSVFGEDLVSLDVGASVDGYIGDTASTIDLSGKWTTLVRTALKALEEAVKEVKHGARLSDIGTRIQETITAGGFSPIKNLSGHGISRFVIHDRPIVPNHTTGSPERLVEGQVIAIEPFATTGRGMVREAESCNIFSLEKHRPVRSPFAREIQDFIEDNYGPLPFTTRWIAKRFGAGKAKLGLRELMAVGALHKYPPLIEASNGMVAVFEKTLLVTQNGCEIRT